MEVISVIYSIRHVQLLNGSQSETHFYCHPPRSMVDSRHCPRLQESFPELELRMSVAIVFRLCSDGLRVVN